MKCNEVSNMNYITIIFVFFLNESKSYTERFMLTTGHLAPPKDFQLMQLTRHHVRLPGVHKQVSSSLRNESCVFACFVSLLYCCAAAMTAQWHYEMGKSTRDIT